MTEIRPEYKTRKAQGYKTIEQAVKEVQGFYVTAHIEFAVKCGLNQSILFDKLVRLQEYWTGKTDDDGNKWVRVELAEWKKELPFWGERTIRRVIEKCENDGLIMSRTFTGRCKWYRVTDDLVNQPIEVTDDSDIPTGQSGQLQVANVASPTGQSGQLPNSLPNTYPKTTTNSSSGGSGDIFILYEQNIGTISPITAQMLADDADEYPYPMIESAVKIAVEANKRNWRYVRGILKRISVEGYQDNRDSHGADNHDAQFGEPETLPDLDQSNDIEAKFHKAAKLYFPGNVYHTHVQNATVQADNGNITIVVNEASHFHLTRGANNHNFAAIAQEIGVESIEVVIGVT